MQSKTKHKQTKLFKAISSALRIGIAKSYALLYMHDDYGDFYKVVSYEDGSHFFDYMMNTSDSILEMNKIYCWGLNFRGLHPNQQLVVFETTLNTIEEDILCSKKFYYGVPLFQNWTTAIGPILKDSSLYHRKFICDFDKIYNSNERAVIFRAHDMHYCILQRFDNQYYPLGYAKIENVHAYFKAAGFVDIPCVEYIESNVWHFQSSIIAGVLDRSLDEYFKVLKEDDNK